MSLVFVIAGILSLGLLGAGLWILVRRLSRPSAAVPEIDRLARISPARYRPMERLLDPAEEAFVAAHADRRAVRQFRARRRQLFRGYLHWLERDFETISAGIRFAVVHSTAASPELAAALAKQQATFAMAVFAVKCRLLLHAAGFGIVDVRGLVAELESMRAAFSQLAPLAAPTSA